MTVGGIVTCVILCLIVATTIFCITAFFGEGSFAGWILGGALAIVMCIGIVMAFMWYYSSTAEGARAIKTQESNFNNGMQRTVKVYDATGSLIQEYTGKFDIEYDDDRILFDDENGLRHIIYYPTGTVIVDEIGE